MIRRRCERRQAGDGTSRKKETMKPFEWKPMEQEPKEDRVLNFPCLLWVYDTELSIGYCNDELAYWLGNRWVGQDEKPIASRPDIEVMQWCYVPVGKNRRKP